MTEFQSRRELREAERQGLVPKPEQVFDLPTGQISIPGSEQTSHNSQPQDVPSVNEMLTRKRLREMERQGILDPLTGSVQVQPAPVQPNPVEAARAYDEVLAETEEPITSTITAVPTAPEVSTTEPQTPAVSTQLITQSPSSIASAAPVPATDIFHSMAVDLNARKPRVGIVVVSILVVLAAAGAAAYMLGIFK